MDSAVRMNKYVCSFDSCCDLFSSMSFACLSSKTNDFYIVAS